MRNEWPAEVVPSPHYAVSMVDAPTSLGAESPRPLVPVPPRNARGTDSNSANPTGAEKDLADQRVERLPPVGSTVPVSGDFLGVRVSSYPGTGY